MKKKFLKQKCKAILDRLMDQSLTVKISVFVYSTVIVLFLILSFFLFTLFGRASNQQLIEEHAKLLKVAILTISSFGVIITIF